MKIHTLAAAGLVLLALAVPFAVASQDPAPAAAVETAVSTAASTGTWEYKVVGLTDLHGLGKTFEALKEAWNDEGGLLGKAKATDEQLAKKTEDLLNALGVDGWELLHYSKTSIVLMRPGR